MKNTLLFFFCFGLISHTFAQFPGGGMGGFGGGQPKKETKIPGTVNDDRPKGTGKISGVMIDSTTNKPVEFANVSILNPKTKKPIDGTMADDKGKFVLKNVAEGDWILSFNFLGLQTKNMSIKVEKKGTDLNLGNVFLLPDVKMLKEVNITGTATLIEEKVDRMVYNAEKDITSKGGDAAEVLRKVPMLSVDLDGNVSLRGSQNIKVLVNNKPSTIIASNVADALKQIPADMIKSVEVITSPSAKYDAEGSAGIINIITKKNTLQGATLNTDFSVGNRGSMLGLNGSYRKGKMGFSLGGHGRANYNVKGELISEQTTKTTEPIITKQTASSLNSGAFGNYTLGWDWDINKNNSITASARYGLRNQHTLQDNLTSQVFKANTMLKDDHRNVDSKDYSQSVDVNLDYTRQLGKPQKELSILSLFSRNNRTNEYNSDLLKADLSTVLSKELNPNTSSNQEETIQIDYQSPIQKNQLLEIGTKGIFRQVTSNYQYFTADASGGNVQNNPARQSNIFDYNQNVWGSYLSYSLQTKNKWSFKVGGRYEYTKIDANFQTDKNVVIPDYSNFVPSINLSKSLKKNRTLKFGYSQRLQRPSIQFLNPNINASNPQSISYGNPYLKPEITDNIEMSLSTVIKSSYLNMTVFARQTNNNISSLRSTDDKGVITTTYDNIGKEQAYGANIFGNLQFTPKFSVGLGMDLFHVYMSSPSLNLSNEGWVSNYRAFMNWTMKNGWGAQGFTFMRPSQIQLQGRQGGMYMYSLGVKKDFKNKKGSIGFAAENFLQPYITIKNTFDSPTFSQNSSNKMYNTGFRITFSYKLGKMSFDAPTKRKKSVNNEDLKKEEGGNADNNTQQQQQPQQQSSGSGNRRPR
jgi:outer membrane receptor protein involved in Fe transport